MRVYLPVKDGPAWRTILPGSGIVGTPEEHGVTIDYEGAKYSLSSMPRWADRIEHAAGRHQWQGRRYPTIARMVVGPEHLVHVGEWDSEERRLTLEDNMAEDIVIWLGCGWLGQDFDAECEVSGWRR